MRTNSPLIFTRPATQLTADIGKNLPVILFYLFRIFSQSYFALLLVTNICLCSLRTEGASLLCQASLFCLQGALPSDSHHSDQEFEPQFSLSLTLYSIKKQHQMLLQADRQTDRQTDKDRWDRLCCHSPDIQDLQKNFPSTIFFPN